MDKPRLIDANALAAKYPDARDFQRKLRDAPTIDAEPVMRGKWLLTNPDEPEMPIWECSECGRIGCLKIRVNYCNFCGSKNE